MFQNSRNSRHFSSSKLFRQLISSPIIVYDAEGENINIQSKNKIHFLPSLLYCVFKHENEPQITLAPNIRIVVAHAQTLFSPVVMYRNLYPKSSFRSCPYTVLVKCPVRFYSIFDEIGQNVDGKMYFYHKSHCSTTITESNYSLFSSLAPANACAQKNCAERFSALKLWANQKPEARSWLPVFFFFFFFFRFKLY